MINIFLLELKPPIPDPGHTHKTPNNDIIIDAQSNSTKGIKTKLNKFGKTSVMSLATESFAKTQIYQIIVSNLMDE